MREIKFRALLHGEVEYINDLYWFEENFIHSGSDCQLMQFTGLQDKNGVDIYEGDIVKTKVPFSRFNRDPAQISFIKGAFVLYSIEFEDDHCEPIPSGVSSHRIEVIGNIHEHQELLKKEDI